MESDVIVHSKAYQLQFLFTLKCFKGMYSATLSFSIALVTIVTYHRTKIVLAAKILTMIIFIRKENKMLLRL